MRQQTRPLKEPAEKVVQDIRRVTRKHYSAEEKIRIVLEGLRGEDSIAELCRREGIAQNLYYRWSKEPYARTSKRGNRGRSIFAPDRIGERRNLPRDKSCCATLGHYKLYIRLAAASARVHPTRFPCLSRRLARAKVAANAAFACSSARLIEAGVGWRSSCAPIDCGAIGPAFGFPADWRTACSNCAILLLQGPACAAATPRPRAAATSKVAESRLIARWRISEHLLTCSIERCRASGVAADPTSGRGQLRRPCVARRPAGWPSALLLKKLGRHDPPAPRTVS